MWGGMVLWMLIVWVGVIVLAIWAASRLFPSTASPSSSAREVVALRHARGQLS